jgi:hypothetical protein
MAWAGLSPAPPSPFNVPIGPHRRYTWVDSEVARFKAIKNALGGTLNDVVLSAVALGSGGSCAAAASTPMTSCSRRWSRVGPRRHAARRAGQPGRPPCGRRCPWA